MHVYKQPGQRKLCQIYIFVLRFHKAKTDPETVVVWQQNADNQMEFKILQFLVWALIFLHLIV